MLPNSVAMRINRPDLARSVKPKGKGMAGASYGGQVAAVGLKDAPGPGTGQTIGARGSIEFTTGALSATMLAGIVIGLGAFYFWTRGHQS